MKSSLLLLAPLALATPSRALAQQASPAPPAVAPSTPADPPSDAAAAVSLPLRLSFMNPGGFHAPLAAGPSGCSDSVDDAGTILPVQPHTQVQLTLRLTFQAFSSLGCPGDAYAAFTNGAGAGFTYEAPLRPNLSLVGSAGAYAQQAGPSKGGGLDLLWKAPERSTSLGLGMSAPPGRGVKVVGRVGGAF